MSFRYEQLTGLMMHGDERLHTPLSRIWIGYSGHGLGLNNPDYQSVHNVGPIPVGRWKLSPAYHHLHLGPVCINIDPIAGTETFGRSLFRIHGEDKDPAFASASHGCIVLPRPIREQINDMILLGDFDLEVVSGRAAA